MPTALELGRQGWQAYLKASRQQPVTELWTKLQAELLAFADFLEDLAQTRPA